MPANGRICRGLRSVPSFEEGATTWLWMWKRGGYYPSPRLISVHGRRSRSNQLGQLSRDDSKGGGSGDTSSGTSGWPCALGWRCGPHARFVESTMSTSGLFHGRRRKELGFYR